MLVEELGLEVERIFEALVVVLVLVLVLVVVECLVLVVVLIVNGKVVLAAMGPPVIHISLACLLSTSSDGGTNGVAPK